MHGDSQVPPCHARYWRMIESHQHHHEIDTNLASHASTLPDRLPSPAQEPQEEEDSYHNDLVQRRRRRTRDRQRRAMEQITMNQNPRAVQSEGPEENIISPPTQLPQDYFLPPVQQEGLEEDIIADTENHQFFRAIQAQRGGDRHVVQELWPSDHQLPPAPEDVLDVQWSQMHRGRRVDSSMYWRTDHALPPVPEDAGSYRIPEHPRLRSMLLEHALRMSQMDEILPSLRARLQALGLEDARTTEMQSLGRGVARTTELQPLSRDLCDVHSRGRLSCNLSALKLRGRRSCILWAVKVRGRRRWETTWMMLLHLHMLLLLHMEAGNWSKVGCIVKGCEDSVSKYSCKQMGLAGTGPGHMCSLQFWHRSMHLSSCSCHG